MTVDLILHFAELQIGNSIKYINTLFGNYFLKCNKVIIILISFNCLSVHNNTQVNKNIYIKARIV